jgi:hypothetical protein
MVLRGFEVSVTPCPEESKCKACAKAQKNVVATASSLEKPRKTRR